jgi:hypothetical protein
MALTGIKLVAPTGILLMFAVLYFSAMLDAGEAGGVRFTDLIPGNYQVDLFKDKQEMIRLYQAIDSVKNRYEESYVRRASGRTRQ